MKDIQILPIQDKNNQIIIDIMNILSDYFSPETIEFAVEKLPSLLWFIAKYKDKVVWFITFETIGKSRAKIYWMGVLPEYQHQGIGSKLMNKAEIIMREQWTKNIELLTLDEHPDYPGYRLTREFYKKHGFEITDFEMQGDIKILTMTKKL